ncbi:hypothetical protein EYF80_004365 [Liparis tanakae]|uniref:Uncharacterized protein n=1 Tax=Liparis tanakae TaxID=230148 RepID=A0A4Z2J6Z9_9TELE|nr:hypothetical protein EYF80_004365 [Liparis tanakae]
MTIDSRQPDENSPRISLAKGKQQVQEGAQKTLVEKTVRVNAGSVFTRRVVIGLHSHSRFHLPAGGKKDAAVCDCAVVIKGLIHITAYPHSFRADNKSRLYNNK